MTTIYLIRHGELTYSYNKQGEKMLYGSDIPLSEHGKSQIETLGERLKKQGKHIDSVYSSPFPRAVQSATILARKFDIPNITTVEDFRDIDNNSSLGMTMNQVLAQKGDFSNDPMVETLTHLADRTYAALKKIVMENKEKLIAVVSHGDAIRTLIFRLEHPDKKIPTMAELFAYDYLDKGEAWCVTFDDEIHLIEKEYIGRPKELWGKGERKS